MQQKASYISNTTQNELLECIRQYVQDQVIDEIKAQSIGPKFSAQAGEVSDMSNKEQMGLILRYVKNGKPIERLVEYIMCESITRASLCENIQQSLRNLQLNLHSTVSQTYDGTANFSADIKGCAVLFQKSVLHTRNFHYRNHDLNLSLCHTCKDAEEIRNMFGFVTEIGLFFKCFPKRAQLHEGTIKQENIAKPRTLTTESAQQRKNSSVRPGGLKGMLCWKKCMTCMIHC